MSVVHDAAAFAVSAIVELETSPAFSRILHFIRAKRATRYLTIIEQTNRTIRYPTISGAHETNDAISNDNLFTRDHLCEKKSNNTMIVSCGACIGTMHSRVHCFVSLSGTDPAKTMN